MELPRLLQAPLEVPACLKATAEMVDGVEAFVNDGRSSISLLANREFGISSMRGQSTAAR